MGVRYSALSPEPWNWNLISIFFMHRGAFMAITGERLSDDGESGHLGPLPGAVRGPADARARTTTHGELRGFVRVLRPYGRREAEAHGQLWTSLWTPRCDRRRPALHAGRHGAAMDTARTGRGTHRFCAGVRHHAPACARDCADDLDRRHDLEFTVLTKLLRVAYRWLPSRFTDTPLVRNRREYERIVAPLKELA